VLPTKPSPPTTIPQDLEHLAASLDGAQMPLLQKIRAFSPAGSKLDLVEAAEAHARQLDQLAPNLSRCVAQ
jgi:laminin alpha 3/5